MTPITWLFCFTIVWAMTVDIQAQEADPLVMVIYHITSESRPEGVKQITLTDLTEAKKLPLGRITPTYFVLLCGDTDTNATHKDFLVKQVKEKLNSEAENLKCEYHLQPYVKLKELHYKPKFYDIGFEFRVPAEIWPKQQETRDTEFIDYLTKFMNEFHINSQDDRKSERLLEIHYDFNRNVPKSITHKVVAHMHSNEYNDECESINVLKDEVKEDKRSYEDLVNIFKLQEAPPDHQWRQLVPKQDFKGIYTTQATCIYLNYVLLHKNAINRLKEIEIFIREVADVINEVHVDSGTYFDTEDNSLVETGQIGHTILTIVWKKITRYELFRKLAFLVVIHNKKSKRICKHEKSIEELKLPEHNPEKEIEIGDMYYCFIDDNIKSQLDLSREPVFNLDSTNLPVIRHNREQKMNTNN